MKMVKNLLLILAAATIFSGVAFAEISEDHKVVIQVSSADKKIQLLALENAMEIQKNFEPGEIKVEVIAYGPGLSIFVQNKKNKQAKQVAELVKAGVTLSACGKTMKKNEAKTSKKKLKLIDGVKVVPDGVVRIMWLQEKGYTYIRP